MTPPADFALPAALQPRQRVRLHTGYAEDGDPHRLTVCLPALGRLRGRLEARHGGARYFLGIRYGSAGRWELPAPVEPWTDIKDASEFG